MDKSEDAFVFPDLSEPYASAFQAAVSFINDRYEPSGILVTGSIIRGNPHPASDLDIVVTHPHHWRQRVQRRFGTVPAEMFVNPPFALEQAMDRDRTSGRPVMVHMLATGTILSDSDGALETLQQTAKELLAKGPSCTPEHLIQQRYYTATQFEDATDIAAIDPELASAFVTDALLSAMRVMFLRDGQWLPRHKLLLVEFARRYPDWGGIVREALRAQSITEKTGLAAPFIRHAAGATGFFEWESTPQPVKP